MNILVLNTGSSSVKFSLVEAETERVRFDGLVDWSGRPARFEVHLSAASAVPAVHRATTVEVTGPHDAVTHVLHQLTGGPQPLLRDRAEVSAIGHRVVHGGPRYSRSVLVTTEVKEGLKALAELAPLHNPINLEGIVAAEAAWPGVPQVAVFDTAFHATLPEAAWTYAVPYHWTTDWQLRRYGFHGLSHAYCSDRAARMLGVGAASRAAPGVDPARLAEPTVGAASRAAPGVGPARLAQPTVGAASRAAPGVGPARLAGPTGEEDRVRGLRVVVCHLGQGCSLAAVRDGVCMNTSMGFTPLDGLVMGTRSGSVDPGLLIHVLRHKGLSADNLDRALNRESGLLGISGVSGDLRQVTAAAEAGVARARLAIDVFTHRLRQAIGAMAMTLGGVDALVFTAGIGEHSAPVRAAACLGLECLGLELDPEANTCCRPDADVARPGSPGRILVIATREDLTIVRETVRVLGEKA